MRLAEAPSILGLQVRRDGAFEALGFVTHRRPKMLAYVSQETYLPVLLAHPSIACVITTEALANRVGPSLGVAVAEDPRDAFFQLHNHLATSTDFYGKSFPTRVDGTATIHDTAYVAPESVVIGEGVKIGPKAVILPGVSIGSQSVVRAGAVVGSEGFQVYHVGERATRVVHAGTVEIGQRVDVHSNTCIDRSVFGVTSIGDDTTIDNLVYVAHDVTIGRRCRIVALAMLAGSCRIGDDTWIGPSSSVSSEVEVGRNAFVSLGAVVTRNVADGERVSGNFAIDHDRFLAFIKSIR